MKNYYQETQIPCGIASKFGTERHSQLDESQQNAQLIVSLLITSFYSFRCLNCHLVDISYVLLVQIQTESIMIHSL